MTQFLKLAKYILPASGACYTVEDVWINLDLVSSMAPYQAVAERSATGRYTDERVLVTSLTFAAAFAEEQIGLTVMETPEYILSLLKDQTL